MATNHFTLYNTKTRLQQIDIVIDEKITSFESFKQIVIEEIKKTSHKNFNNITVYFDDKKKCSDMLKSMDNNWKENIRQNSISKVKTFKEKILSFRKKTTFFNSLIELKINEKLTKEIIHDINKDTLIEAKIEKVNQPQPSEIAVATKTRNYPETINICNMELSKNESMPLIAMLYYPSSGYPSKPSSIDFTKYDIKSCNSGWNIGK